MGIVLCSLQNLYLFLILFRIQLNIRLLLRLWAPRPRPFFLGHINLPNFLFASHKLPVICALNYTVKIILPIFIIFWGYNLGPGHSQISVLTCEFHFNYIFLKWGLLVSLYSRDHKIMGLGRNACSAVPFLVIDFKTLEMGTFHGTILINCCNFTFSSKWNCASVRVREL